MFGFSFGEFLLICVVALVAVGPQKLPTVLRTLGQWTRKARNMVYDMRAQSGIDDILRAEGFHGGLHELRSLMRGQHLSALTSSLEADVRAPVDAPAVVEMTALGANPSAHADDPYAGVEIDATREYPPEGADAYGALPDDLLDDVPAAAGYALDAEPQEPLVPGSPRSAPAA